MLEIFTFGGLTIKLDGEPVRGFDSRKVEGLLVYLAVSRRTHPREVLATMLWDDLSQDKALSNLRGVLSNLRGLLKDYVVITRDRVGLNEASEIWTDVFEAETVLESHHGHGLISASDRIQFERVVKLYQGDFLAGFYLSSAPMFEDWAVRKREQLHILASDALKDLVAYDLAHGEYKSGIRNANRWIEIDPLVEAAHRELMRLLALTGQREAALAQYEVCQKILMEELALEPTYETRELAEMIRMGEPLEPGDLQEAPVPIHPIPPAFVDSSAVDIGPTMSVFVGREHQLDILQEYLQKALDGRGQVSFISGVAGQGKTALMKAFSERVQEAYPDLLVAGGDCIAYSGAGDPYLPFRDVLNMFTGDVESHWKDGSISLDHARRLWYASLDAIRSLVYEGPDLIGVLVPGVGLLNRILVSGQERGEFARRLENLTERGVFQAGEFAQLQLFEQYTRVLRDLSTHHPLLILLDDLQWADTASLNLLLHLGKRLSGNRVFILGAYRPDEVAAGRSGENHPLEKILVELRRTMGEILIDLDRPEEADGRAFVEAYLKSQPNRLTEEFKVALYHRTRGHPLFTVELVRTMQERGDLILDADGKWVEGSNLVWDERPARVEAVIEQRIQQLDDNLKQLLFVACVVGETFAAQILAQVLEWDEYRVLSLLSKDIEGKHRFIREFGDEKIDGRWLTRYRFSHILFQEHLYRSLGVGERRVLHAKVALAIEALYQSNLEAAIPQLAHHYAEAGKLMEAIEFARQAARRANAMYAYEEAVQHLQNALEWLADKGSDLLRADFLEQLADNIVLIGERRRAIQLYEEALTLLEAGGCTDRIVFIRLHRKIGESVVYMPLHTDRERFAGIKRDHFQAALDLSEFEPAHMEVVRLLILLSYEAWYQRYPADWDTAERHAKSAVSVAERLDSSMVLSAALDALGNVYGARGLFRERLQVARRRLDLSQEPGFSDTREKASILHEVGISLMQVGEYLSAIHYLQDCEKLSDGIQDLYLQFEAMNELARSYYYVDQWDNVLTIYQKWRELEAKYLNYPERIGPYCFFLALISSVYANRGRFELSGQLRDESLRLMVTLSGPPSGWNRHNYY